jgi:hypothetical protein
MIRVFGYKKDETEDRRRFHNELHGLFRSSNIASIITSRRLMWTNHVAKVEGWSASEKFNRLPK